MIGMFLNHKNRFRFFGASGSLEYQSIFRVIHFRLFLSRRLDSEPNVRTGLNGPAPFGVGEANKIIVSFHAGKTGKK